MKRMLSGLVLAALLWGPGATAQPVVKNGKVLRSAREDLARLEKELGEQRALLLRILQLQVEHDQQLLRLAQGQGFTPVAVTPPPPADPSPAPPAPAVEPRKGEPAGATRRAASVGTVTGTLKVTGARGPAWVFVEDVKGPPASGSLEIRQEDKQFWPRVAVVPRGTRISFPNFDSIFHNVFSVSAGNEFDLGTTRKGDPVKTHVAMTPGVVEIFCNMHSRMSSSVLVTPSALFTKVGADGRFRLDGVPVGTHRISAWAGGSSMATESVEVDASGGEVALQLEVSDTGPHKNKAGQPYGSYGD